MRTALSFQHYKYTHTITHISVYNRIHSVIWLQSILLSKQQQQSLNEPNVYVLCAHNFGWLVYWLTCIKFGYFERADLLLTNMSKCVLSSLCKIHDVRTMDIQVESFCTTQPNKLHQSMHLRARVCVCSSRRRHWRGVWQHCKREYAIYEQKLKNHKTKATTQMTQKHVPISVVIFYVINIYRNSNASVYYIICIEYHITQNKYSHKHWKRKEKQIQIISRIFSVSATISPPPSPPPTTKQIQK